MDAIFGYGLAYHSRNRWKVTRSVVPPTQDPEWGVRTRSAGPFIDINANPALHSGSTSSVSPHENQIFYDGGQ